MTPRVAVLTPPGTGAIAVVAVVGPGAWQVASPLLRRPGGRPAPAAPPEPAFWYGTLADGGEGPGDEVILAVVQLDPTPWVEVHCHGGRRAVRVVVEALVGRGAVEVPAAELPGRGEFDDRALGPLTHAPTLRTAGVLLDQYYGAFRAAEASTDPGVGQRLAGFAGLGRHLVEPWRVVVAGPPNVGKSSLVNALAGFDRSVVAPVAGTTRDIVTADVAFAGWPVRLTDTAGLRATADELEAAGVGLARGELAAADAVIWVFDSTDPHPVWPTAADRLPAGRVITVANKTDRPAAWAVADQPGVRPVSAATGAGVAALAAAVAELLVPVEPGPGEAVPLPGAAGTNRPTGPAAPPAPGGGLT